MAETKSLAASVRSGVGKGAARSVRREGRIPAVVYGGGEPPTPIALSWHEVNKLIYAGHFMTTTFDIEIDGRKERVIPRDYQLDPVKDKPLHVDFLRLKAGQKIDVEIPIHVINQEEAPGIKKGGVVNVVRHVIELKVAADAIPETIELDIAGMEIGDSKHVADLKLPRGAKLTEEGDFTVLTIAAPVEEVVDEPVEAPVTEAEHGGDDAAEAIEGDKSGKDEKSETADT